MKKINIGRVALAGLMPIMGASFAFLPVASVAQEKIAAPKAHDERGFAAVAVFGRAELAESAANLSRAVKAEAGALISFVVLGEVNCPGEFELPGVVSPIDAILLAGGPSARGSMRRIEISRDNKPVGEFDLYDYLLSGCNKSQFVFEGGEVVSVPAAGPLVKIVGKVNRAGLFEARPNEMFLDKMLQLCGGLLESESGHRIEILRQIGGYRRSFLALELGAAEKIPAAALEPGDEIFVAAKSNVPANVILEGCCEKNVVPFREGIRLSDLLKKSGLKADAALEYAEVLRENGGGDVCEAIGFSPGALLNGKQEMDMSLRPADRVVIFSQKFLGRNPLIFVEGLVARPGKFALAAGADIKKAIIDAGGIKSDSMPLAAELSRREIVDGSLQFSRIEINLAAALRDDPRHNLVLKPFDSLRIFKP